MKIKKAENYKKPGYAVAVAAALVAVTVSGCGTVEIVGEQSIPMDYVNHSDPVIYDGGLQVDPGYDDEIELSGDVAVWVDGSEGNKTQEYCEPDAGELVLEGGVEFSVPESK